MLRAPGGSPSTVTCSGAGCGGPGHGGAMAGGAELSAVMANGVWGSLSNVTRGRRKRGSRGVGRCRRRGRGSVDGGESTVKILCGR